MICTRLQGPLYFANQVAVRGGLKLQELRAQVLPSRVILNLLGIYWAMYAADPS